MRLWSLHPSYLDAQGLVALWREGLLARKVLQDQTRGYRHHSQLVRFQEFSDPVAAILAYLWGVYEEAARRGYHFDYSKIIIKPTEIELKVTIGQLEYEFMHLINKLKLRNLQQYRKIVSVKIPSAHPIFLIVPGEIEKWEKIK